MVSKGYQRLPKVTEPVGRCPGMGQEWDSGRDTLGELRVEG